MYYPVYLKSENELKKVLKNQRKSRREIGILFISLWDKRSQSLLEDLKTVENRRGLPLYVVDSFKMPHAFVIFSSTRLPHLIQFTKLGMESEFYLSRIYNELGL
jgi:hypothetical protein